MESNLNQHFKVENDTTRIFIKTEAEDEVPESEEDYSMGLNSKLKVNHENPLEFSNVDILQPKLDLCFFESVIKPLLVEDPLPTINFMKQKWLLRNQLRCKICDVIMHWTKKMSIIDKYVWKCQNKLCSKYKRDESIRKDSFFFRSRLSLQKWIETIFYWCQEIPVSKAVPLLNISRVTLTDIYNVFRVICRRHFEKNQIKLGGPGKIVQIDESCVIHNPKYNGVHDVWVVGIVDASTSPSVGYMQIVDSCNAETILPIISKVIFPGSIIHSYQRESYCNIEKDLGYTHHTLNISGSGGHIQDMESYWSKHKLRFKRMMGSKRISLNSHLQEFMWLERNEHDTFDKFCDTIANQYIL